MLVVSAFVICLSIQDGNLTGIFASSREMPFYPQYFALLLATAINWPLDQEGIKTCIAILAALIGAIMAFLIGMRVIQSINSSSKQQSITQSEHRNVK